MGFNQSTCRYVRQRHVFSSWASLNMLSTRLGTYRHVTLPYPLAYPGARQHNKVERLVETIRRVHYCHGHTASPTSGTNHVHNLFCSLNTLMCIAFLSCRQSWVVLLHFTCMCLHLHWETIVPSNGFGSLTHMR